MIKNSKLMLLLKLSSVTLFLISCLFTMSSQATLYQANDETTPWNTENTVVPTINMSHSFKISLDAHYISLRGYLNIELKIIEHWKQQYILVEVNSSSCNVHKNNFAQKYKFFEKDSSPIKPITRNAYLNGPKEYCTANNIKLTLHVHPTIKIAMWNKVNINFCNARGSEFYFYLWGNSSLCMNNISSKKLSVTCSNNSQFSANNILTEYFRCGCLGNSKFYVNDIDATECEVWGGQGTGEAFITQMKTKKLDLNPKESQYKFVFSGQTTITVGQGKDNKNVSLFFYTPESLKDKLQSTSQEKKYTDIKICFD